MKKLRSHLAYGAFLFALAAVIVGCAGLFEPADNERPRLHHPGDVQPAKPIVKIVRDTGDAFGPMGSAVSDAIIGGLIIGSHFLNKRNAAKAIEQHKTDFHATKETPPKI